jgi:hypothetical protein
MYFTVLEYEIKLTGQINAQFLIISRNSYNIYYDILEFSMKVYPTK